MRSRFPLSVALLALPLALAQPALGESQPAANVAGQTQPAANAPAANAAAQQEPQAPLTREQSLTKAGVAFVKGPCVAKLGKVAEIKVPEGSFFIGEEGLPRFLELTHNMSSGNDVGVMLSGNWTLFFEFDEIGYVKDDEKDSLNADKLMKSMTENQEAANEERTKRGWSAMKMQGWATKPHYDKTTNNLKWAFNLSSSEDNYKSIWINESIRLLGRRGVMNVTLVTDPEDFAAAEKEADEVLASRFNYVAGEKYAEFKSGDKLAEYGLAALVLGGGVAVAAKTGLLAKFWKLIVAGVLGLGALISKFFKKLAGKDVE